METMEFLDLIKRGESSSVKFKELVNYAYKIATEMVAFSNSSGGLIIIGINDKTGTITGLSYADIQKTNSLLVNAASDNVKSPIAIITQTLTVEDKNVLVVEIKEGTNKPYKDNKGISWIKNGPDKRKVTSNEELARLLQKSGNIHADEQIIPTSKLEDIDLKAFKNCLYRKYYEKFSAIKFSMEQLLKLSIEEAAFRTVPVSVPHMIAK